MVKVYDSMDCFVTMLAAFMRLNIPSLPGVDSAQFFQSIKRRNNRIVSGLGYFSYAFFCVLYHKSCDKLPLSTLGRSLFCSGCLAWFYPCHFNLAGGAAWHCEPGKRRRYSSSMSVTVCGGEDRNRLYSGDALMDAIFVSGYALI